MLKYHDKNVVFLIMLIICANIDRLYAKPQCMLKKHDNLFHGILNGGASWEPSSRRLLNKKYYFLFYKQLFRKLKKKTFISQIQLNIILCLQTAVL